MSVEQAKDVVHYIAAQGYSDIRLTAVTWSTLSGIPSTFPPTLPIAWANLSGVPSTFPPTVPIAYSNISGTPTLGTAAALNVPASGNASSSQVVLGNPERSLATTLLVPAARR
jgi:hypothetical protein